jgi:hypothetical protein
MYKGLKSQQCFSKKGLTNKIDFFKLNKKFRDIILKNRHFTKEDTLMASKHVADQMSLGNFKLEQP